MAEDTLQKRIPYPVTIESTETLINEIFTNINRIVKFVEEYYQITIENQTSKLKTSIKKILSEQGPNINALTHSLDSFFEAVANELPEDVQTDYHSRVVKMGRSILSPLRLYTTPDIQATIKAPEER